MTEVSAQQVLGAAVSAVGGSDRPGQQQMAQAVGDALVNQRHLMVQAGTGTGKSLGYLVPSLLHGDRVVVATATLGLQHQLVERDIPALKAAVGSLMNDVPHHAVVKGRANYACLHRVRRGAPDGQGTLVEVPDGSLGAEVVQLRQWTESQVTSAGAGDRDSAPPHSDRAWRQISVNHRECLGATRCDFAQECFAEIARDDAATAQLVITNHALLAIDAIDGVPMLPSYSAVVVDEAHELAARVTQAATLELSADVVQRAAGRARSFHDGVAVDDLADAADTLVEVLTRLDEGRIDKPEEHLTAALASVRDAARACVSGLKSPGEAHEPDAGRQAALAACEDVRAVAEAMVGAGLTEVLWLSDNRGNKQLHVAPIDVAEALRAKLFGAKTVVLTSATLTLGGQFDAVALALGLDPSKPDYDSIDIGSPFDYPRQSMLYVARHLPAFGSVGMAEPHLTEIFDLINAAGGRTLGLFSSRRAAELAAESVRKKIADDQSGDFDVWCQGDAQLSELVARFSAEPRTCLFGTISLWQGIDLPGDTCQLVIIDRIPFPRPDDPLMSARQRLVESRGGNGFMTVAASHAALLLAQGAGRLIRRQSDRGVVAVLDPRLATARYGSFLTASMPPMWRTVDREVVLAALQRLDIAARQA